MVSDIPVRYFILLCNIITTFAVAEKFFILFFIILIRKTFCREKNDNLMIDTSTEVNEKSMQTMFNHLCHLSDIR